MICFSISKPGCYYFRFFSPLYDTYYVTIKTCYVTIMSLFFLQFFKLDYYFILCQILENSYYFTYFIFLHYSFQLYQLKHCYDTYFQSNVLCHLFLLTCHGIILLLFSVSIMSIIVIKTYYDTIKTLILFNYIVCIMSFDVYYVNYLYDNKLFQSLFSIISFRLK